jgi:hypothetical protein
VHATEDAGTLGEFGEKREDFEELVDIRTVGL